MKPLLSCSLVLALITLAHAATYPTGPDPRFTAKELRQGYRDHFILAHPRASHRATIDAEEAADHIQVHEKFARFGELRVIQLADADNADAAIARLRATARYDFVEPDYIRYAQATPNDPQYTDGTLWALNNTGQLGGTAGSDIKAARAWDIIHDAPNVIVAIVDTGLNLNHQDIAANLWTNPNPTYGDLHGANFVGGSGLPVSGSPADDNGHGTHVAGTIGAVGNNGLAVTGVAWKVQIMAVKGLGATGSGTSSDLAGAINYAIGHGASIINASYGALGATGFSQTELTAIASAQTHGIIFVAAAGNDTANLDVSRSYPASFALDNIVTVGASTRYNDVASFSDYGAAIDLFAPGEDITSLDYSSNTGTISMSGTSMAAPQVSGALALIRAEFPNDTYRQAINRMLRGVTPGANFAGKSQTGGLLNLYGALTTTTNRPFNDDFAARPHFTVSNLAIRSNNAGATAEPGEPAHAGVTASSTLWWEWAPTASGTVTINTSGSTYDTVLAVYTGTALTALTPVVSNDDDAGNMTSRVTFAAQAGTTYEIAVDGKNGATGMLLLNVGTTPGNDAFASPVVLSGTTTHLTASNANCSREPGEPHILGFAGGASVWYKWTAPTTGQYQIATVSNDFDPIMAVYTGTSLSALTLVSASDNTGFDNSQTGSLCTINATAGTTYLITVDSKSASTVGQFTLSLVDSLWQATTGDIVTSAPAIGSDGTVYVGGVDNTLYALKSDGSLKWSATLGGGVDTCSPAIADDGTLYVGANDGKLYAYTAAGTQKWAHDFSAAAGTAVGAGCSPAIGTDGTIYIRITDGYLHALNPADGSEKWKANINSTVPSFYGNPVIGADGTIYQGSDENDSGFYAFNANGTQKWRFTADSGTYGPPAIDSAGNIYFATLTGSVYSITPANVQRWHVTSGGNVSSGIALSADGKTLFYGGYDAKLYARDTATGAVVWSCALGDQVRASSPAVDANGVVYIGCYDYKVYAVNSDGTVKRTYDTGNIIRSAPAIGGGRLYVGSNDQKLYAFGIGADVAGGWWPQYRSNARRLGRSVVTALSISSQPQSQSVVAGQPLNLSVTAIGQAPLTYQWSKDGTTISGATSSTYSVASVTTATAGTYTVTILGPQGSVTSAGATVSIQAANPGRLVNVSVRTTAGTGSQTLTVGFVVTGSAPKPLLVRGVGPTLVQYTVTDALADPSLALVNLAGVTVAANDNWSDPTLPAIASSVGAFPLPAGSKDAALTTTVPADNYSLVITGVNNTVGTALAEVYDLDPTDPSVTPSRIVNVSARAQVNAGGDVLVAGFSISGNVPKQVLIRGVGPGLGAAGVTGFIVDPRLDVYQGQTVVTSNDNWGGTATLSAAFQKVAAFPLDPASKDAAVLVTLSPGTYTAQMSGVGGVTGVGLIEVYEMP